MAQNNEYVRAEHHHWHPQGLAIGRGIRLCLLEVPQESEYIEFGVNVKGTWITAMDRSLRRRWMKRLKKGIIVMGQVIWILQIKFSYRSRIRVLLYNTYVLNMPAL